MYIDPLLSRASSRFRGGTERWTDSSDCNTCNLTNVVNVTVIFNATIHVNASATFQTVNIFNVITIFTGSRCSRGQQSGRCGLASGWLLPILITNRHGETFGKLLQA
jgi:hypothetical protein